MTYTTMDHRQNRQAPAEAVPILATADCGGGEDCFYCACPETD